MMFPVKFSLQLDKKNSKIIRHTVSEYHSGQFAWGLDNNNNNNDYYNSNCQPWMYICTSQVSFLWGFITIEQKKKTL